MHWVDRGAEPDGLLAIRTRYGPSWVRYYVNNVGSRPTDSHWRDFFEILDQRFSGNCGFCEEVCKGEVDHFRPIKKFPELVYEWTNWVLSCHDCNSAKWMKWPDRGYVDPCASSRTARAENFFDFDILTGSIKPANGLTPIRHKKAVNTIRDLKLNHFHHLRKRLNWLKMLELLLGELGKSNPRFLKLIEESSSRDYELSSLTRAWTVTAL